MTTSRETTTGRFLATRNAPTLAVAAIALAVTLAGISLLASPAAADGSTVTVCEDGCDFATIQDAEDAASPGDTILVRPAVYIESVLVDTANVTICSTTADGTDCDPSPSSTTIDATLVDDSAVTVRADDVTVRGFTMQVRQGPARVVDAKGVSGVALEDNRVETGTTSLPTLDAAGALGNRSTWQYHHHPFVRDTYESGLVQELDREHADDANFTQAVPVPGDSPYVALLYNGGIPDDVETQTATEDRPRIEPVSHDVETLAANVSDEAWDEATVVETFQADATEGPSPTTGVGPGADIVTDLEGNGQVGCSSAWVFTDDAGDYYLGAAGHCYLASETASGVGETWPSTDDPRFQGATVNVCVESCEGTFTDFNGSTFVEAADVVWARQVSEDGDEIGHDFGIAKIHEEDLDLVRTNLPLWGGPEEAASHGEPNVSLTPQLALQYGHGDLVGDHFLTEGRGGLASWDTDNGTDFSYLGPAATGDSGSPVGLAETADFVIEPQANDALGIVTHIGIDGIHFPGPPVQSTIGTHIQRAYDMVAAETDITGFRLVPADEDVELPDLAPPTNLQVSDLQTGSELDLTWDEPSIAQDDPDYEIHRSQGSTSFADKTLVATVSKTSFTDTGLTEDQEYCYQLVTLAGGDASEPSEEVCGTPTDPPTTQIVKRPDWARATVDDRKRSVNVLWGDPVGDNEDDADLAADEFVIRRAEDGGQFSTVATFRADARTFLDKDVSPGEAYEYRVVARNTTENRDAPPREAGAAPARDAATWPTAFHDGSRDAAADASGQIRLPGVLAESAGPGAIESTPVVADVDQDGSNEVVAVRDTHTPGGRVTVEAYELRGRNLVQLWSTEIPADLPLNAEPTDGVGHASLADLDRDGRTEVAVATNYRTDAGVSLNDGGLFVLDGTDGEILDSDGGDLVIGEETPPLVADLSHAGTAQPEAPEIGVVDFQGGTTSQARFNVFRFADGELARISSTGLGGDRVAAPPVALETDTRPDEPASPGAEVAIATGENSDADGAVFVCEPETEENSPCRQLATLPTGARGLATATLEPTSSDHLVVTGRDGSTLAVRATTPNGTETAESAQPLYSQPAVVDTGEDQIFPELVSTRAHPAVDANAGDLAFHELDDAGLFPLGVLERRPDDLLERRDAFGGPAFADVSGDDALEAIVADENGTVAAVAPDLSSGGPAPVWRVHLGEPVTGPVAVADVDDDSNVEIVAGTSEGTLAVVDQAPDRGPPVQQGLDLVGTEDATVAGNTVFNEPGWCRANGGLDCTPPLVLGVHAAGEAEIRDNRIATEFADADEGDLGSTWGVSTQTAEPVTIRDNAIANWTAGAVVAWSPHTTIEDNVLATDFRGVQLAADHARIEGNAIQRTDAAVFVAGSPAFAPQDVTLRDNELGLTNNVSVKFEPDKAGAVLDARLNDWGVLGEEAIRETRVGGDEDNTVLVEPYLDGAGNAHPPLPEVYCFTPDGDGASSQELVAETLGLQEAVDAELPDECVDRGDDGDVDRVILLRKDDVEPYDAATIDADVALLSKTAAETVDRALQGERGDPPGGARIEAAHGPALELAPGADDTLVDGVTLDAREAGPALLARGLPADARPVVQDTLAIGNATAPRVGILAEDGPAPLLANDLVTDADPAVRFADTAGGAVQDTLVRQRIDADEATLGVHLDGADDATVTRTSVHGNAHPGSIGIRADAASSPALEANVLRGTGTGVYVAHSANATVRDNVVTSSTVSQFGADTLGISLFEGRDHATEANLLKGVGTGLVVHGAENVSSNLDTFRAVSTGVEVDDLTGDARTDLHLHNASLNATLTPLTLTTATRDLLVDATCNDWGAYQRETIEARIDDDGHNNTIDVDPWTSLDQQDGDVSCLAPPEAAFSVQDPTPGDPVTRLDDVQFLDESEEGTRPITDWRYAFGDGDHHNATVADGEEARNPNHTYERTGTFDAVLEVEDADGQRGRAVREIQVVNLAPSLDPIPDQSEHHTRTIAFDVHAEDPEEDPISLEAHLEGQPEGTLPGDATFTDDGDGNGSLEWNPAPDAFGTYTLNVTATDGLGDTVHQLVDVEVVNAAPRFPDLPGIAGGAEGRELVLPVDAEDPDPADDIERLDANLSELPDNATFTVDGSSGTLVWTPGVGENGTYTVSFTAESPGRSTTEDVQLEIREDNSPPTLETFPTDPTATAGTTAEVLAQASDDDGPQSTVDWRVTTDPPVDAALNVNGDEARWVWDVPADWRDPVEVTFHADDGLGEVSTATTVTIQVAPFVDLRTPIELQTGETTLRPVEGADVKLTFLSADPDGSLSADDFTVYPKGTDGPALDATALDEPDLWDATFTYTDPGDHEVVVEATDADGHTATDRLGNLRVVPNTPPEVELDPPEVETEAAGPNGRTVTLSADAEDPEGRAIPNASFTWTLPGDVAGDTLTGRSVQATLPVGAHTVQLDVTDPFGATTTRTVDVRVDDAIRAAGELDAPREDGFHRVRPTEDSFGMLEGWVNVTDDLQTGVEDALVQGTVRYHGTSLNDAAGVTTATFSDRTDASGTYEFAYQQEVLGVQPTDFESSLLSAPGWHEIHVNVTADSRTGAPDSGLETASETILYWVGPEPTGPVG